MGMISCQLQLCRLSSACQTLRDTRGSGAPVFIYSCIVLLCASIDWMRHRGSCYSLCLLLVPLNIASLDPSRRRTWADLAQEFLKQYSFNTVVDVSRRELKALRQRPDKLVTSFISYWRKKIAQIIDRPSERDQISMIMRNLQPRFARHLMGFPQTDFRSLV